MVTINDIAKEAGVSISTVSNVIHGVKTHVSPETAEIVFFCESLESFTIEARLLD